ncbi:unnamed protein product [Pieris macdunnoughi]|uniref:Uncharacterized protein n=1 Tax=Pieris macdunnoughi TaxID=345717 RepID=A0A821XSG2_9NEOP|nr:unnamed protein product [Pieris macdunnoughi]
MKIPETGNVGAYYGNEEHGQWQPNGVIIDNGVGGGIVGSGDAGVLRPPAPVYPVHMPRGGPMSGECMIVHWGMGQNMYSSECGYMMGGGYYGAAGPGYPPDDFSDYMWMENEEEFDKQVMQQLEEEALMEQCIEAMLEDEQRERRAARDNGHGSTTSNSSTPVSLQEAISKSTLNPLAAEFVPGRACPPPEERSDPPESKELPKEDTQTTEPESTDAQITDEKESTPQTEPPEVSAADVQPIEDDKKSKEKPKSKSDKKKPEVKPKAKVDNKVKKDPKLKTVQSDVKAAPSESVKNEIKSVHSEKCVKSEVQSEDNQSIEVVKQSSQPPSDEPSSGFKPVNYAAAAKANKPKKATTPPASLPEKTIPPKTEKPKDKNPPKTTAPKVKTDKPAVKVDKPIQRKNSTK